MLQRYYNFGHVTKSVGAFMRQGVCRVNNSLYFCSKLEIHNYVLRTKDTRDICCAQSDAQL